MNDPMKINLQTPEEVRAQGWAAEARDTDGHLIRTHAPFDTDADIVWFVRDAMGHGETATIWPHDLQNRVDGD